MIATLVLVLVGLTAAGCATSRTGHVQPGRVDDLRRVQTVEVAKFNCPDSTVAQAVRMTVIEMLLPTGLRFVESGGDAVITGAVTMSTEATSSGLMTASKAVGLVGGVESGSGTYVSGISAHVTMDGEIIAAASTTQGGRSPPQVLAREHGSELGAIFRPALRRSSGWTY
jgi:hypothetical protein